MHLINAFKQSNSNPIEAYTFSKAVVKKEEIQQQKFSSNHALHN